MAPTPKGQAPSERRRARRHPASRLPKVHVSILAGPDVKLVDVSPQGLLVESEVRLIVGAAVCLTVKFDNESHLVGGRVARVSATLDGKTVRYLAGIALDGSFAPFDLPGPEHCAATTPAPQTPAQQTDKTTAGVNPESVSKLASAPTPAAEAEQREQQPDRRMIAMLKSALQASERSRMDADTDQRKTRETWEQERRTFEQALEIAARHKDKLSSALQTSAAEARDAAMALQEERAAAQALQAALQDQLAAATARSTDLARELDEIREANTRLERTLDEERAMLGGLLEEKDTLLAQLEEFRVRTAALSAERDQASDASARSHAEQKRLSQQLEAAERWCADQHALIYELWQQGLRSTALIEGWKSSRTGREDRTGAPPAVLQPASSVTAEDTNPISVGAERPATSPPRAAREK